MGITFTEIMCLMRPLVLTKVSLAYTVENYTTQNSLLNKDADYFARNKLKAGVCLTC